MSRQCGLSMCWVCALMLCLVISACDDGDASVTLEPVDAGRSGDAGLDDPVGTDAGKDAAVDDAAVDGGDAHDPDAGSAATCSHEFGFPPECLDNGSIALWECSDEIPCCEGAICGSALVENPGSSTGSAAGRAAA